MTDIASMEALLARVESATGPDRELDGAIEVQARRLAAYRVGLTDETRAKWQTERGFVWDGGAEYVAPAYTASLDAIKALTEQEFPNAMFRVASDPDSGAVVAELIFAQPPFDHVKAHGNTEALARTAVFLRACIAAMERKE